MAKTKRKVKHKPLPDDEQFGPWKFSDDVFCEWKNHYFWYKYPDRKNASYEDNAMYEEQDELCAAIDFGSTEARMFYAGWYDACNLISHRVFQSIVDEHNDD